MRDSDAPLKLRAVDDDDLATFSAVLQDALVEMADLAYLPEERRFVLVASRFRWERVPEPRGPGAPRRDEPFQRVLTGVRFENVRSSSRRGFENRAKGAALELLSVERGGSAIFLRFAGGGDIRLEIEGLACYLEDLAEPWPVSRRPVHKE